MISAPNLYTRWTRRSPRRVHADILGMPGVTVEYDTEAGTVLGRVAPSIGEPVEMDPDTARMIGVRLIEAATRAEGERRERVQS